MLTTNVTRQDRLFLRLTGPKMVSTCEKSISKRVFTSIWLTHISFSLLSFKITGKQAWFWFLCYKTRHQNFRWKHGYFIEFLILRRFVHCTFRASTRPKQCVIDAYKGLRPTKASNTFVQQLGLQGKRAKQVGREDHHSPI